MNKINWTAVIVFAIVVLLVFLVGVSLLGGWGYGGWGGMMGPGRMGPGMMGGWGYSPFGWIGMIFMWLVPIGFILLIALGVVWLIRAIGSGRNPALPARACPNCERSVLADWRNCPYCGTELVMHKT
jgi:hypothetical protein